MSVINMVPATFNVNRINMILGSKHHLYIDREKDVQPRSADWQYTNILAFSQILMCLQVGQSTHA